MNRSAARRYVLAYADQGLTALLSLGVSLWLIRRGVPEAFGAYVFWANTVLVIGTLVAGMTAVHLHRLPPGPPTARRGAERVILSATIAFTALAALGTAAAVPLLSPPFGLWAAVVFVPGTLVGLYARSLAASRGVLGAAAAVSAAVFATVLLGLAVGFLLDQAATAQEVLLLAGVGQAVGGGWALAWLARAGGGSAAGPDFGRDTRRRWRAMLRRSGWPVLAGMANETSTRLYIFLVAAWAGAPALASLGAAQMMLRPATLLAGAWAAAARTGLAARRYAGDAGGFRRLVVIGGAGPALATFGLGLALAAAWPLVSRYLYGGRYPDLAGVVVLWGVNMGLSCFVVAGTVALQALRRLRAAAAAEVVAALVCAVAMPAVLLVLPPPAVLGSMILALALQVTLQARAVRRALRTVGAG